MKAMLLCAGEGTRLRPYTHLIPKPAIPFLNIPLIYHTVEFIKELNITEVTANTFHLEKKIQDCLEGYPFPLKINFSSDGENLLNSGGGLGHARKYFLDEDHFILVNGDEIILPKEQNTLQKAFENHKKNNAIATLIVTENSEVGSKFGGAWVDKKNHILGFGKTPISADNGFQKGYHFIGVTIFSKKIFEFIPPGASNILYDCVVNSIKAGHSAQVIPVDCHWFETGNVIDFKQATIDCLKLINESLSITEGKVIEINENCQDFVKKNISIEAEFLLKTLIKHNKGNYSFYKNKLGLSIIPNELNLSQYALLGFNVLGKDIYSESNIEILNSIIGMKLKLEKTKYENEMVLF